MSVQPPSPPPVYAPQGSGKAVVGGLVQPFAAALGTLAVGGVGLLLGHDPGAAYDTAIQTVISIPVTVLAIYYTPHNLFGA
jgi:hypothetical protein